ncbi:hypothetical protein, partial [Enterobacter hormaechei]|uniref:hypothetical protein n=1 Tax=Enterobacter hormaechei TaxID=158836 RepID=UPI001F31569C
VLDAGFRQHFASCSCDRPQFFAGILVNPGAMARLFLTAIRNKRRDESLKHYSVFTMYALIMEYGVLTL